MKRKYPDDKLTSNKENNLKNIEPQAINHDSKKRHLKKEIGNLGLLSKNINNELNSAVQYFLGHNPSRESLLDFNTYYYSNICSYLINMAPNHAQYLRVIFSDAEDNTVSFKNQLSSLIALSKNLNKPAIFISKEPGDTNHFICGILNNKQLFLINPLGLSDKTIFYQVLGELQQEQIIDKIGLSNTRLQQSEYELLLDEYTRALVSCGPIIIELVIHLLTQFTPQEFDEFWNYLINENICELSLANQIKLVHSITNLSDIPNFLPNKLQSLLHIQSEAHYKRTITDIRQTHQARLDLLPKIAQKLLNISAEDYLSSVSEGKAHSQTVFNALITGEKLENIAKTSEAYQALQVELNPNYQAPLYYSSQLHQDNIWHFWLTQFSEVSEKLPKNSPWEELCLFHYNKVNKLTQEFFSIKTKLQQIVNLNPSVLESSYYSYQEILNILNKQISLINEQLFQKKPTTDRFFLMHTLSQFFHINTQHIEAMFSPIWQLLDPNLLMLVIKEPRKIQDLQESYRTIANEFNKLLSFINTTFQHYLFMDDTNILTTQCLTIGAASFGNFTEIEETLEMLSKIKTILLSFDKQIAEALLSMQDDNETFLLSESTQKNIKDFVNELQRLEKNVQNNPLIEVNPSSNQEFLETQQTLLCLLETMSNFFPQLKLGTFNPISLFQLVKALQINQLETRLQNNIQQRSNYPSFEVKQQLQELFNIGDSLQEIMKVLSNELSDLLPLLQEKIFFKNNLQYEVLCKIPAFDDKLTDIIIDIASNGYFQLLKQISQSINNFSINNFCYDDTEETVFFRTCIAGYPKTLAIMHQYGGQQEWNNSTTTSIQQDHNEISGPVIESTPFHNFALFKHHQLLKQYYKYNQLKALPIWVIHIIFNRIDDLKNIYNEMPESIQEIDSIGFGIVHWAALLGTPQLLKTVIQLGGNPNAKSVSNDDITPLYLTCMVGRQDNLIVLLDNDAQIIPAKTFSCEHPLQVAIFYGHKQCALTILNYFKTKDTERLKTAINYRDQEQQTALHIACYLGYNTIVDALLMEDIPDIIKKEALAIAQKKGHITCVKQLNPHAYYMILPDEILSRIFSYLLPETIVLKIGIIDRKHHNLVINDNIIWQEKFIKHFGYLFNHSYRKPKHLSWYEVFHAIYQQEYSEFLNKYKCSFIKENCSSWSDNSFFTLSNSERLHILAYISMNNPNYLMYQSSRFVSQVYENPIMLEKNWKTDHEEIHDLNSKELSIALQKSNMTQYKVGKFILNSYRPTHFDLLPQIIYDPTKITHLVHENIEELRINEHLLLLTMVKIGHVKLLNDILNKYENFFKPLITSYHNPFPHVPDLSLIPLIDKVKDLGLQHAIVLAAKRGYSEILSLLLDKGRHLITLDNKALCLTYAIQNGHINAVELLLQDQEVVMRIDKSFYGYQKPLNLAIMGEHVEILQMLIKAGAKVTLSPQKLIDILGNSTKKVTIDIKNILLKAANNQQKNNATKRSTAQSIRFFSQISNETPDKRKGSDNNGPNKHMRL